MGSAARQWLGSLFSVRDGVRNDPPWSLLAARAMVWLVAIACVLASTRAWFSGKPWMLFFEDDFYYYLKVAQNIAHGSGSTFNGLVPTNGYHPLWLLVVTAFSFFSTRGAAIFWFVAASAFIASLSVYFLARTLLEEMHLGELRRSALAAYLAIYSLHLFYTGMEVILAIPLMFLLMVVFLRRSYWQRSFWAACSLGLIVSATILSRLDLLLLVGLLALLTLLDAEIRRSLTLSQLGGIALGLLPLAAYFGVNHTVFHTWMPVSGMAKQLKFTHLPSLRPWEAFYGRNANHWINLVPVHLGLIALPSRVEAPERCPARALSRDPGLPVRLHRDPLLPQRLADLAVVLLPAARRAVRQLDPLQHAAAHPAHHGRTCLRHCNLGAGSG